ncbi:MAG TPA: single-stranded-DNA-specific exonuclease RecJ, partial [Lacipirellulaceae bacterium]|nr:single-stranded-DNA-specific exonuclease RecJ [Lacipirellulaceae bacterium]
VGIVSGRLAEKHAIPCAVVALDPLGVKPGIGSARSVAGFNLHAALAACSEHLEGFGGHAAAAGFRVAETKLPAFRRAFCAVVSESLDRSTGAVELQVDAETVLPCLTHETVAQIESLAPFGHGNARPVLCTSDVRLAEPPRRIGEAGRHLAMTFDQRGVRIRAVAFNGGEWEPELAALNGSPLSIAFRPVINRFRGRTSVEIHLADWRVDR